MRELARREPTFALHVHIGVGDPEPGIDLCNRLRGHLALPGGAGVRRLMSAAHRRRRSPADERCPPAPAFAGW